MGTAANAQPTGDPHADRRCRQRAPGRHLGARCRAMRRSRLPEATHDVSIASHLPALVRRLSGAVAAAGAAPRALSAGMQGDGVRWLRTPSTRCMVARAKQSASDYYDEELVRMVEEFQRQHRLNVDGIAGVQTQIVLDTLNNTAGAPLLVAQAQDSPGASTDELHSRCAEEIRERTPAADRSFARRRAGQPASQRQAVVGPRGRRSAGDQSRRVAGRADARWRREDEHAASCAKPGGECAAATPRGRATQMPLPASAESQPRGNPQPMRRRVRRCTRSPTRRALPMPGIAPEPGAAAFRGRQRP